MTSYEFEKFNPSSHPSSLIHLLSDTSTSKITTNKFQTIIIIISLNFFVRTSLANSICWDVWCLITNIKRQKQNNTLDFFMSHETRQKIKFECLNSLPVKGFLIWVGSWRMLANIVRTRESRSYRNVLGVKTCVNKCFLEQICSHTRIKKKSFGFV